MEHNLSSTISPNQIAKRKSMRRWGIALALFFLDFVILLAAKQYDNYFDIPFASLLFTITLSTEGADISFILTLVLEALPKLLCAMGALALAALLTLRIPFSLSLPLRSGKALNLSLHTCASWGALLLSICFLPVTLSHADKVLGLSEYYGTTGTTVYEAYYTDPATVQITPPDQKKNLIYIYLESMETQYASVEDGGQLPVNYIPHATKLAQDNISFSNTDKLGGFSSLPGSTWTIGAIFSSQSGIPFAFPVDQNEMGAYETFVPSVVALGDILEEHGYVQEFLCGSDIKFAGRDKFLRDHGNFEIYDYFTAIEEGVIPPDYHVFWGYEDKYLYEIAKSELLELSQQDQPFNFTMLTVDTHHFAGYVCELCEPHENTQDAQLGSVISCADRQLDDFIKWLKMQSFYKDSVVVIVGDHPRMDTFLIADLDYLDRTMYNCFLNVQTPVSNRTEFRQFSTMDLFPTTLSALGFTIEGNRLGLGTDLFSQTPTLIEAHSLEYWNTELQKRSDYYDKYIAR